jgi:hypothetical protein
MVGQLPWGIVRPYLSVAGHAEGTHSRSVLPTMKRLPVYSVLARAMALVRMGLLDRKMLAPSLLAPTPTLVIPSAPSRLTRSFV